VIRRFAAALGLDGHVMALVAQLVRQHPWALLAQAVGLGFGAALIALLGAYLQAGRAGEIPGAPCADRLARVSWESSTGVVDRLRPAQVAALTALRSADMHREILWAATVRAPGLEQAGTIALVSPDWLSVLCVKEADAFALASRAPRLALAVRAGFPIARGQSLHVDSEPGTVATLVEEFVGRDPAAPLLGWADVRHAAALGVDLTRSDAQALTTVFLAPRAGVGFDAVERELAGIVIAQPALFQGGRLRLSRNLSLGGASIEVLQRTQLALAAVAALVALLIAINLGLYQAGRAARAVPLLQTLIAIGARRTTRAVIAAAEPLALALLSVPSALTFVWILHRALTSTLADPAIERALSLPVAQAGSLGLACVLGASVVTWRIVAARRVTFVSAVDARARGARLQPYLMGLQLFSATVAAALALAAGLHLRASLPAAPTYHLDGLRLYVLSGPDGFEPPDLLGPILRAQTQLRADTGLDWAFSTNPLPLAVGSADGITPTMTGGNAEGMSLADAGGATDGFINRVTPNFFDVLGVAPGARGGHPLPLSPQSHQTVEPVQGVANRAWWDARARAPQPRAVAQLLTTWTGKQPGGRTPIELVGWVEEGTTGNDSPTYTLRLRPILYTPLTRVHWGIASLVAWVRVPPGYDASRLDAAAARAAALLFVQGTAAPALDAAEVFEAATARERDSATLSAVAAGGIGVIATLGIVAIIATIARQTARRRAIAYALGASRRVIARQFLASITPAAVAGTALAALAVAGVAAMFPAIAGPVSAYASGASLGALVLLLLVFTLCAVRQWRAVRDADPTAHYLAGGE
jgi:hypothetical protein